MFVWKKSSLGKQRDAKYINNTIICSRTRTRPINHIGFDRRDRSRRDYDNDCDMSAASRWPSSRARELSVNTCCTIRLRTGCDDDIDHTVSCTQRRLGGLSSARKRATTCNVNHLFSSARALTSHPKAAHHFRSNVAHAWMTRVLLSRAVIRFTAAHFDERTHTHIHTGLSLPLWHALN